MPLEVVVLAAGKGKRMHSKQPKVLHTIADKTLLQHVIDAAKGLQPQKIHVVYGHQGKQVKAALAHENINWVHQAEQRGTGHAVLQALEFVASDSEVLILVSDAPLIQLSTLRELLAAHEHSDLTLLTAKLDNPFGLGRIVTEGAKVKAIVEEKDASEEQKKITEINSGMMVCQSKHLQSWLPKLSSDNAQGELYLTDIVEMAVNEQRTVGKHVVSDAMEVQGINDKLQLEMVERAYQVRMAEALLKQGVHLRDKSRVDIRGELSCGQDVSIDVNTIFEGKVSIADDVSIGANCIIKDSTLHKGAVIHPNSVIEGADIGELAQVGPFARIRLGTELAKAAKIGNFVETKKILLGEGSKASHLTYLGDCVIGKNVNVGAGTVTCNYDGVNKHQTTLEDGVFIGSGTMLVAPVHVGTNATIGAGSTLRKDAPAEKLTLTAAPQKTVVSWQRPKKK